jgi:hypothetical protein
MLEPIDCTLRYLCLEAETTATAGELIAFNGVICHCGISLDPFGDGVLFGTKSAKGIEDWVIIRLSYSYKLLER